MKKWKFKMVRPSYCPVFTVILNKKAAFHMELSVTDKIAVYSYFKHRYCNLQ